MYTASRIEWVAIKLNKFLLDLLHRNRMNQYGCFFIFFSDKKIRVHKQKKKLAINTYAYQLGT